MSSREEILHPKIMCFLGITSGWIIQFLGRPSSIFCESSASFNFLKGMVTFRSKQTGLVLNGGVQKFFWNITPQYELWTEKYSWNSLPMAYCETKSFRIPKSQTVTIIMPCFSYCILYFPQYCLSLLTVCLMIPVLFLNCPPSCCIQTAEGTQEMFWCNNCMLWPQFPTVEG